MTFLHKSYCEWSKVEKPLLVPMCNEWLNDDEKVEIVLTNN